MKNPTMTQPSDGRQVRGEDSPFTTEFFLVQGAGFRCMAHRDNEGKWREAFSKRVLPGPIHVLE